EPPGSRPPAMFLFAELDIGAAVLNLDDAFGRSLCTVARAPIHGYGLDVLDTEGLAGWVQGSEPVCDTDGLRLSVHTHLGAAELASTLLGRFNAQNLLACLAALLALGMPLDEAVGRLARSRTVPGRMERFGGGADRPLAVVDYAHTPNALQSVLTALRAHTAGRLYCVFGCGGDRDAGKRPLMGAAAERLADRVILTSDNPRSEDPLAILADIRAGCAEPARVQVEPERAAAIRQALAAARPGDVVLIAGKGHEDYQIIGSERRVYSDRAEVAALFGETSA
ncbi:MAG TPA: UDP-N-acetylmuramyl-tripeptide synthetase, partial [Plasticicumulans sp.]|nr:UDP-N-acetylmuramyl-tripeptide synthetase [Plasticicumulans sp.]